MKMRPVRPKPWNPITLAVCEGETERDLIAEYARLFRVHVNACKAEGTDPISIVQTAARKAKEDGVRYDDVLCVFDRDDQHDGFSTAIDLCRRKNFIPIVSNPCLEVWPILHFDFRHSGFGRSDEVIKALKKSPGFANYDKDGVHIFRETSHRLDTGCKNAAMLAKKQNDDPRNDPYTGMHLLIQQLKTRKVQ